MSLTLILPACRFMRQLCSWPGFETASEEVLRFIQKLVEFFTNDYLDILESAHYHVVYHYDERWPKLTGVAEAEEEEEQETHHADAEIDEVESESEDEEEDDDEEEEAAGEVRSRELSPEDIAAAEAASAAAAAAGAAAGVAAGASGATAGAAAAEGHGKSVAAIGAAAGKAAYSAAIKKSKAQAKAKACTPRAIKQGTVTTTAEGKKILTKHNGTVIPYVSKAAAVKELTEKSHTHGFDHITAVSQASINAWFKSLWSVASSSKSTADSLLSRFSYEQYFSSSFQAPTIRLLSNNKAIIWIHLQDGWLKTLKNWAPCGE